MLRDRTRHRWIVALLFATSWTAACATPPLRESSWVVVGSPRFEIFSTMPPDETVALAEELERFHALVYALTGATDVPAAIPTRIFAFANRWEYRPFELKQGVGDFVGYFSAGVRWNQIVLVDHSRAFGAPPIIRHEYVHHLVRNGALRRLPMWWDEGYAELLSTAELRDGVIEVGDIPEVRKPWLARGPWIPMDRIVRASSYEEFSSDISLTMFYAEAWALVHYLILDREGADAIVHELPSYLARLEQGVDPSEAFEAAFGLSTGEIDSLVRRRLRAGMRIVGLPESKLAYDRTPPTARAPRPGEVATRLGQLHLARGEAEKAEAEFVAALAADPGASRAHAGLGDALKFQKRLEEAAPHFDRACALEPDRLLNELDRAEFHHDLAVAQTRSDERERLLRSARDAYRRILERDPTLAEAWLMLGRTHLAFGEDPKAALAPIERAMALLPSSSQILYSLAETHVALGHDDQALALMVRAFAARSEGAILDQAREQVEQIRKRRGLAATKEADGEGDG